MPVSKKPRKKKKTTNPKKSENVVPFPSLPDPRGMEGGMANLLGAATDTDPINAAQNIMYDAWEATDRKERVELAKKALNVSSLCADAYVLFAEEEAKNIEEAFSWYRKGVEAGEQALGPEGFEKYSGHFWGFLETRPYMRARAGFAATLWHLGKHDEAIEHYQAMLELNPNDNQGIRYVLASHLLATNNIDRLKSLIGQYDEDSTDWLYPQVLLAYRSSDPDAGKLAEEAWLANSSVPDALSGKLPVIASPNGYVTMGGEDEAASYVHANGNIWRTTPGAVEWLIEVTRKLKPHKRRD